MISFVKRAKLLVTSIWTWCSLRWCNYYFLAAFQIILSLACVSRETHKLFPSLVNIGASGPITKYIRQTLGYFLLSPNLARAIARAQIDLASPSPRWVISFTLRFFENWEMWQGVCCGFYKEWKLVSTSFDQIQVKQIILKVSGR